MADALKPADPDVRLTDGDLTLRPPTVDDAAELAQIVVANLDHLQPWMTWATSDYDEQGAADYITGKIDPTARPLLMLDGDGRIVGSTGLNDLDALNRVANLGYWVRADACGRGYATRATDLVARYGIDTVGLQRVEIFMSVHNEPSRLVAERSIATYEGIQRNRLRYDGQQHDAHIYVVLAATL
ncbi:MAG: GNAT family N-acetyltransferase [Acidimicrobiales bacterium]|nr:GNAT family N-acetyltransferase [Acidimicrobiales bacterium]